MSILSFRFNKLAKMFYWLPAFILLQNCSYHETTPYTAAPEVVQSKQRYKKEYVLAAGDQLEVHVYRNADASRVVVIRPDGFISIPLLDDVKAAGLTVAQLDDRITHLLGQRLRDPEVTIIVANPMEPMVYVLGEVGFVKPVPLRQARTAAQAIAYSGGLKIQAAKKHIAVIRLEDDGYFRTYLFDSPNKGESGNFMALSNMALSADDIVVVPESNRSRTSRFIQDFITTPFTAFNQILTPYFQLLLLEEVRDDS